MLSLSLMIKAPFLPELSSSSSARSLLMLGRCHGNDMRRPLSELSHFLLNAAQLIQSIVILVSWTKKCTAEKYQNISLPSALQHLNELFPSQGSCRRLQMTIFMHAYTNHVLATWVTADQKDIAVVIFVWFCISSGKVSSGNFFRGLNTILTKKTTHKQGNTNRQVVFLLMCAISAAITFAFMHCVDFAF